MVSVRAKVIALSAATLCAAKVSFAAAAEDKDVQASATRDNELAWGNLRDNSFKGEGLKVYHGDAPQLRGDPRSPEEEEQAGYRILQEQLGEDVEYMCTHSGPFQLDDVMAAVLLKQLPGSGAVLPQGWLWESFCPGVAIAEDVIVSVKMTSSQFAVGGFAVRTTCIRGSISLEGGQMEMNS